MIIQPLGLWVTSMKVSNFLFPDLTVRSPEKELMDLPTSDRSQLFRTLKQFKWMNMFVSRYRWLIKRYIISDMLCSPSRCYHLLDVGSGGCDIPFWIATYCRTKGLNLKITCMDSDPWVVRFSRRVYGGVKEMEIINDSTSDLGRHGRSYDYIFANHFFHHLPEEDLLPTLSKIYDATRRVFLISDIYRSNMSYFWFTLIVPFLFRHSFIYADGKTSIRRGFIRREFEALVQRLNSPGLIVVGSKFPGRIYMVGDRTV